MLDGSGGECGTVLPEISCVSVAHEPLLQIGRHAQSVKQ